MDWTIGAAIFLIIIAIGVIGIIIWLFIPEKQGKVNDSEYDDNDI